MVIRQSSDLVWSEESPTAKAAQRIRELRSAGKEVIDFTQGRPEPPDFPLPYGLVEGMMKALKPRSLKRQKGVYTPMAGIGELRELLVRDFSKEVGVPYQKSEAMISVGGRTPLALALRVLVDRIDAQEEVLFLTPAWPIYRRLIRNVGGVPLAVRLRTPFKLKCEDIARRLFDVRLGALLLNSPNNPTGVIIEPEELAKIARVIRDRNKLYKNKRPLGVILDWLYQDIVFNRNAQNLLAVAPDLKDQVITVNGISKNFNATGLRLGFAFGPENLIQAMVNLQSDFPGPAPSEVQYGVLAALTKYRRETDREVEMFRRRHKKRRDYAYNELWQFGLEPLRPEGTFYIWVKLPVGSGCRYASDRDWTNALLEKKYVGVMPGTDFECPGYMRLSLAVSWPIVREGIRRILGFAKENFNQSRQV